MDGTLDLYSLQTVPLSYSWDSGTPTVEFVEGFLTSTSTLAQSSTNSSGVEYVGYAPFFSVSLSSAPGIPLLSSVSLKRTVNFGDYYNSGTTYSSTDTLSSELFCHNYIMPGLYTITYTEEEYVLVEGEAANNRAYKCLDKYCIDWTWRNTDCASGGTDVTWASTLSSQPYEKTWRNQGGCDAPWALHAGLYVQTIEDSARAPLSWQWYNFLGSNNGNPSNTPVTWAQSSLQGTNEMTWAGTSGPCYSVSFQDVSWKWNTVSCNLTGNALSNPIKWDDTQNTELLARTWDEVASACSEVPMSLSAVTQTVVKEALVRVLEIPPTAYLAVLDQPENPEQRVSPMSVRLTARYTKCGSFPLEKIVWDLGDGSPLLTQREWANDTSSPFDYTGIFNLDYQDPRNYDVLHTYKRTGAGVYTFYPSMTAYSSSTGTTDCCKVAVGPLQLPSTTELSLNLVQSELTESGTVIAADIEGSAVLWFAENSTKIPTSTPTPTPTPTPTSTPNATLYFYSLTDTSWYTLDNWFLDHQILGESHTTIAAPALPTTTDDVVLLSDVMLLGQDTTVNTAAFGFSAGGSDYSPTFSDAISTLTCTAGATFVNESINAGLITGDASFTNLSFNNTGCIIGDASFTNSSCNGFGYITGNASFYDNTYNFLGDVYGDTTFYDNAYNYDGHVYGDTTFNDNSFNSVVGYLYGNATFNGYSWNDGGVNGNATFKDQSSAFFGSFISGNADVYYPAQNPLGGTVSGTTTYYGYEFAL